MNDKDRRPLTPPHPTFGHLLPEGEGREFGRYDGRRRRGASARRQPSSSGRGQGEGSDVTSSLAVVGVGASAGLRLTLLLVSQTGRTNVSVDPHDSCISVLAGVGSGNSVFLRTRSSAVGVLAPAPITAREEFASDPSPCPLPEGEGFHRSPIPYPRAQSAITDH
jgi:hypothetical protein